MSPGPMLIVMESHGSIGTDCPPTGTVSISRRFKARQSAAVLPVTASGIVQSQSLNACCVIDSTSTVAMLGTATGLTSDWFLYRVTAMTQSRE